MDMDKRPQPNYDPKKRSKANITAVLRSIVAFYLAYLGWNVAQNAGGVNTTMKPWMGWVICAVFTLVAIGFEFYTLRQYQADLKNAELPAEPSLEERDDPGEEEP